MSSPKAKPHSLEIEVAQLRAQVGALTELLIECGLVDRSMLEGRLHGAAARVAPRPLGQPPKRPGWFSRLFQRRAAAPSVPAERPRRTTDLTLPEVNLPFKPIALYGESERVTTDRRHLTPTSVGKCERCWRMRPLSVDRLCVRCGG